MYWSPSVPDVTTDGLGPGSLATSLAGFTVPVGERGGGVGPPHLLDTVHGLHGPFRRLCGDHHDRHLHFRVVFTVTEIFRGTGSRQIVFRGLF